MPSYKIGGIDVQFPYNAYDCQLVYMERVIHALQQGCNALLESPTGTGKTLCLLCTTLAWRASLKPESVDENVTGIGIDTQFENVTSSQDFLKKKRLPTILYSSRTHSQLQQVIRELKATVYRPKMVVLGSREQMCIHPDVQSMRGRVQTHACRNMVKERKCGHHNRVSDFVKMHPDLGVEPVDIEDLVKIGRSHGPCPYYLSRELHSSADVIFLPYNYLIDKENRGSLTGIDWEKTVLIFDEAHNLESLCADAASFDLPAAHLTACIGEAKQCVEFAISQRGMDNDMSINPDNFAVLKALLLELERRINEVTIDSTELGFTRPGEFMFEFLAAMKINWQTATMLIDTIERASNLLEDATAGAGVGKRSAGPAYRLLSLRDALKLIFRGAETTHSAYYKVHIHEVRSEDGEKGFRKGIGGKVSRTLSWWCFNPGIAMEEFAKLGVRSVVLTSGTLAPLDSFAYELNLPFNVRLENPHVIDNSQIWVGVVGFGPSGRPLNSSYKTRDSPEYVQELGNAIVNFARIVPDGLLVFFPSYYLLNACIEAWQSLGKGASVNSTTIWERICKFKQPVVEPKESALFNQATESFMAKLGDKSSSGAAFFAVCRGKASEGLDFADRAGRAVVMTGMPFAMKTDPKVRLKRKYLDDAVRSNPKNKRGLRGEEWYVQQAARAVNQAVGRVIRHRNDYGAIILCDERFGQGNFQSQMSLWLRPHIKCYSKFGDAAFTLTRFFRGKEIANPPQKPLKEITNSEKKERGAAQDGGDNVGVKTSVSGGHVAGLPRSQQPSTEILAASRAPISRHCLSSVSIVQANCAVGSSTGFVHASRGVKSDMQVQEKTTVSAPDVGKGISTTSLVSQVKSSYDSESGAIVSPICIEKDCKMQASMNLSNDVKYSNSLKRRPVEPLEKPWSLSRCLSRDIEVVHNIVESPEGLEAGRACSSIHKRTESREDTLLVNHCPEVSCVGDSAMEQGKNQNVSVEGSSVGQSEVNPCQKQGSDQNLCAEGSCVGDPVADRSMNQKQGSNQNLFVEGSCAGDLVGEPSIEQKNNRNLGSVAQMQQKTTDGQERKEKVLDSSSTRKKTDAAGFLQEVKAHLSLVEYKRFLECMRGLKNQLMSMSSLLMVMSSLFSAPERVFLFRKFGDFVPSQHRQLYEESLAAICAEFGLPSDLNHGKVEMIQKFGRS